jgi:hypothetical protein
MENRRQETVPHPIAHSSAEYLPHLPFNARQQAPLLLHGFRNPANVGRVFQKGAFCDVCFFHN